MLAPLITADVMDFYHGQRVTPVVIYPEVFDNPFKAPFFARYVLNFPGLLAPRYKEPENYAFAYSRALAERCGIEDTLFMPTCDLGFFNSKGAATTRAGTCFYAGKLKGDLGGVPENVPRGSVEILKSSKMSRTEIREIFWKCEAFYCYEDSALAIEANLCGCPTVFVKNEHFSGIPLANDELGWDGNCQLDEPGGLERAKRTVANSETHIRTAFALAPARIRELASKMKGLAVAKPYQGKIDYPYEVRLVFFDWPAAAGLESLEKTLERVSRYRRPKFMSFLQSLYDVLRQQGIGEAFKRAIAPIRRHGLKKVIAMVFGIR
jgi:hypothetical protein